MNMKMIRQLFPLAIGGIALGSTEFIPMGLMRTMGGDLHLSDCCLCNRGRGRGSYLGRT